jgi:hypothetical protein
MGEMPETVKVAVVQASPVLFDREATLKKTCDLIGDISAKGVDLILFPEAFIPAYPRGSVLGPSSAAEVRRDVVPSNATGPMPSKSRDLPPRFWARRPVKPASIWRSGS